MGGTGRKDPASGQSPGICPDTSRHPHCQPVGAAGSLPAYPQQHGLSDVLFHFREHPVRQGRPSLRLLFLDIKLEPAHQRAGHLSAGPDRRTGSESLCQPGSTGQISEWPYQATAHYFTEISPAIPKEYADCFKVNGCLLPATPSRGRNRQKPQHFPHRRKPHSRRRPQPPRKGGNP